MICIITHYIYRRVLTITGILTHLICISPLMAAVSIQPVSNAVVIKVTDFRSPSLNAIVQSRLAHYRPHPIPILVVDLRNNAGGFIHDALYFSALFVPTTNLIEVIASNNQLVSITRPNNHPLIQTNQLVILINQGTASAAEAAALVLKKHSNAILVGQPSFGKKRIESITTRPSPYQQLNFSTNHLMPDIPFNFKESPQGIHPSTIQAILRLLSNTHH